MGVAIGIEAIVSGRVGISEHQYARHRAFAFRELEIGSKPKQVHNHEIASSLVG